MLVTFLGGPFNGEEREFPETSRQIEYVSFNDYEVLAVDMPPHDPVWFQHKFYDVFTRPDGTNFAVEALVAAEIRRMDDKHRQHIDKIRESLKCGS